MASPSSKLFILIHGAWHGNWCWEKIGLGLHQHGHNALMPNLPGHGENNKDFTNITMTSYVEAISDLVNTQCQPVILVGHSLAGMIISQVAENIPDKVQKLVYVAGFLPTNNSSASSLSETFSSQGLSPELDVHKEENTIYLKESDRLKGLFYNRCPDFIQEMAINLLQPEPFYPFIDPVMLSSKNFGQVDKTYIECAQDLVILPIDQQIMQQNAPCQKFTLPSADHSPFFSCPEELINILCNV